MLIEKSTLEQERVAHLDYGALTDEVQACLDRLSNQDRVSYETVNDFILYLVLQSRQYDLLESLSVDEQERFLVKMLAVRYRTVLIANTEQELWERLNVFAKSSFVQYRQVENHREWKIWSNIMAALS